MSKVSRRSLAHWAASELASGKPAQNVARHLAAVLKESKMEKQIDFLVNDIAWELEHQKTLVIGKVTSAHQLSERLAGELAQQIKEITKAKNVVLVNNIDKSVIGGMRVETSNLVWDQTVSRKLSELREVF
jgi:F0F1-type ATP synthase delta subunit